ncbi:MAG: hypothetical protein ACRC0G_07270 [Fusobacteriaceae bacterium]
MAEYLKFVIKFITYTIKYNLLFKIFFRLKTTNGYIVLIEILYVLIITGVYFYDVARMVRSVLTF